MSNRFWIRGDYALVAAAAVVALALAYVLSPGSKTPTCSHPTKFEAIFGECQP